MASQTQKQLIKEYENTISLLLKKKIKTKPRHIPTQETQVPIGWGGIQNCQIIEVQCDKLNIEISLSKMHTHSDVLMFNLGQSGRVHSYVTSGMKTSM